MYKEIVAFFGVKCKQGFEIFKLFLAINYIITPPIYDVVTLKSDDK